MLSSSSKALAMSARTSWSLALPDRNFLMSLRQASFFSLRKYRVLSTALGKS